MSKLKISISKGSIGWVLETSIKINRPREEVFEFFSKAENLEILTPDFLNFNTLTPLPIKMREGAVIDYRLKIRGIPIRWQSEISVWDPPRRFVDEQKHGPYKFWNHEHTFEDRGDYTVVRDRVSYGVPGGALVNSLLVRRDLEKIFAYRQKCLELIFGDDSQSTSVYESFGQKVQLFI